MQIINKMMTICAIVMLTILGLSRYDAQAIQFCTDEGGGVSSCREVSGWKTVVTGVTDEGGGNNPSGVCDAGLDFPRFRPGTKFVTFAAFTCEGELLRTSFSHYCVGSTPPSVGQVIFSNCPTCFDNDNDGHPSGDPTCNLDCNDNDSSIHPDANELCDKKDNNCNGKIDEDGVCAAEVCDGIDNNGDGQIDEGFDSDGDGVTTCGGDCNDNDPTIFPGAPELCDTKDNNCNGQIDETCNACSGNNQQVNSSVNRASGNLYDTKNLLFFSGGPLSLNFTISYNSRDTYDFPLGRGWTHLYNVQIRQDDGITLALVDEGGRWVFYQSDGTDTYSPEPRSGLIDPIIKRGDGSYTWRKKDGTIFSFDPEGRLSSIIDRNQNALNLVYQDNRLAQVQDPGGHTFTFTYDIADRITKLTDSSGRSVSFSYSPSGELLEIIGASGDTWHYSYDRSGQLILKTDPTDNTISYNYDSEGRLISSIDPSGIPITISYQLEENQTAVTDRDGGQTTYLYDPILDKPLLIIAPDGGMTSNTYDTKGNLISSIDPAGNSTSYTYDDMGNILSITDPNGGITRYTYDPLFNQVTSITDPSGNITTYTYDALGNLLSVTDPTGGVTRYSYDAQGRLIALTNSLGQVTRFTYDGEGNLIGITDPAGATTTMTYDEIGNMTSRTDPNGATTYFKYDALNRLIKTIDPLGNATTFTYDSRGNRTSSTDAMGRTTQYEYNYQNRLIRVIDPQGGMTSYTYDAKGNLTSITDANGQTTNYSYDSLNRLISETDPLGNTIRYSYDQKGNLIQKTDANGQVITFTYDSLNRLTRKAYSDGGFESFTYDSNGRIISAGNQYISYTLSYDAAGRNTQSTDSRGYTVRYRYDSAGNRTNLTYPDGGSATYSYDQANRLSGMIDWNGRNTTFNYDNVGRRVGLNLSNGTKASYGYDQAGRLTDLSHKTGGGSILDSFSYTYDPIGNRLSVTRPEEKLNYTYDLLDHLIQATPTKLQGKDKTQEHKAEEFTYDPVGNRITGPEAKDTYSYNQGNQLVSDRKNQYQYDRNGNLISKTETDDDGSTKNWKYSYDFENRLIKVIKEEASETKTITFKYDPFGRRIEKKITESPSPLGGDGGGEGKTYTYVYDNEDIIAEYLTKTENGVSRTETTRYLHGPGIDEPLEIERKGESYSYHADGLGSITALTDSRQKAMESYSYSSFGDLKRQGDKVKNTYTFTGREWDEEINLYYYRARYYDAEVGRFVGRDPIGFIGGTNLYVYSQNNPIRYIDPFGLMIYEVIEQIVAVNNLSGQSNEMIICMCWKESSFDPNAQSSKSSARGLMAVTKGAATDAGYDYNLLFDSAINIQAGSKYLKLRIQRANGNVTKGLEGYGTGPGYATNILQCEKCLKDSPCGSQKCLNLIHP